MNLFSKIILFLGFSFFSPLLFADSFDTTQVYQLNDSSWSFVNKGRYNEAISITNQALEISRVGKFKRGEARSFAMLAVIGQYQGNFNLSVHYNLLAAAIFSEIGDKKGLASAQGNLAIIYGYLGYYSKAIESHLKSLQLKEEMISNKKNVPDSALILNLKASIANTLNNLALIYSAQKDFDKSSIYFQKALDVYLGTDNKKGVCYVYNNIGLNYSEQGNNEQALKYFQPALQIQEKIGDVNGIAASYQNIGSAYLHMRDFEKSERNLNLSVKTYNTLNDKVGIISSYINLSVLKTWLREYQDAEKNINRALTLAKETGNREKMMDAHYKYARLDSAKGVFDSALYHYKEYTSLKDSLFNESKSKEIGKLEAKYDFEKQQKEDERLQIEHLKLEIEKKQRRNNIQYSVIFIAILAVFGTILSLGFITVSPKFAEGLIFFAFLIFFEFCLVLLDPYVDKYSGGEPAYKLLFNAVLAGAIFPAHAFFEKLLKKRLIND